MKTISNIIFLAILFSSCDAYFNEKLHQNIPDDAAYATVKDITNALNGAYYTFGSAEFQGRNIPAIGDLASDNATADPTSGHLVAISTYTYTDQTDELKEIWTAGYSIIDASTRIIQGAKELLANRPFNTTDSATLNSSIAQAYALRAHSAFMLVNLFSLPIGSDQSPHGGLVIVEERPISANEHISRSSTDATYQWILRDIAQANATPNIISKTPQFYFNPAAIKALEARVNLYLKNYTTAISAANHAIILRNSTPVDSATYLSMWSSTAISAEDIFTISKSINDNLSGNSLNTLYGSYGCKITSELITIFDVHDWRSGLIQRTNNHPKKFDGLPEAAAVNNIPVYRISEMYLILAEAYAMTDNPKAQEALLFTAKRNPTITDIQALPSDKQPLLAFIAAERRRELFTEGHRWFDVRRNKEKISLNNGTIPAFDLSKLAYPIPAAEINSGSGVEQNSDWMESMPE